MPRVSSENSETPKRAPRRRVAKPKTVSVASEAPVSVPRRKSPTALPTSSPSVASRRKVSSKKYVALGLMISGLAIAGFIGYSDKGQIDIAAVITERNAKLTAGVSGSEGGDPSSFIVPVQNTSNLPDGGLIGSTEPITVPAPPVVETGTTTSTSTATTTEEVVSTSEGDVSATTEEVVESVTETTEAEGATL
jgi:hypothetical protein